MSDEFYNERERKSYEPPRFTSAREMLDYMANNGEGWFPADDPANLIYGFRDKHGDTASITLVNLKKTGPVLSDEERKCLEVRGGRYKIVELLRSKKDGDG